MSSLQGVCLKRGPRPAGAPGRGRAGARKAQGARPRIVAMNASMGGSEPVDELLAYDERGLVPCVVQDWRTGEVLMLAYMDEQALARTRETGELHLWSRSRQEPWHKGATSGNVQKVRALRL